MYAKTLSDGVKFRASKPPVGHLEDPPGREIKNQCHGCLHFNRKKGTTCAAFPKGIPFAILLGEYDHTYQYNVGDSNDHGVTYTPREHGI